MIIYHYFDTEFALPIVPTIVRQSMAIQKNKIRKIPGPKNILLKKSVRKLFRAAIMHFTRGAWIHR